MKFTIQLTCQMLKNQQTIDTICFVQSPEVETKFSKLISAKAVFFFFFQTGLDPIRCRIY